MDPLLAKAHGKVGGTSTKSKTSKKKKRSTRSQSAGQPTGTSESSHLSKPKYALPSEISRGSSSESSNGAAVTMHAIHVLDVGLGISYIVIGAMSQEMEVTTVLILLGSLLLLGSLCGTVGYCFKSCNRVGLAGSIVIGMILCLAYTGGFIWALVSWDSFLAFFDHDEEIIADKHILMIIALAVLALLEGIRILVTGATRNQLLKHDSQSKLGSTRSTSTTSSSSTWNGLLNWFGLSKKKRTDDFVMFDDNASMESSLLWSKDGGQPSSDDYLEFVPEHERGLANYTSNVALPLPPEDKIDY